MLMTVYVGKKRNVVGDVYKDLLNTFEKKEKMYVVIPAAYEVDEFSTDFFHVEQEKFTIESFKKSKMKAYKFAQNLFIEIQRYNIKKVFVFCENHWFNLILLHMTNKLDVHINMWIHDPIPHEGERKHVLFTRWFMYTFYKNKFKKIFVSYEKGKKIISEKKEFKATKIKTIYLPQMKQLEFDDIKKSSKENLYDIVFFGRLEKYKGINILLEAYEQLVQKYNKKIKMLIVGRGEEAEKINRMTKKYNSIVFINAYVESRKLAEYISQSKYVVLPYTNATGTQTVQVANYYHKPVIVHNIGCFEEYVEDEVNGWKINDINAENLAETIHNIIYKNKEIQIDKMSNYFNEKFNIKKITNTLENELFSY